MVFLRSKGLFNISIVILTLALSGCAVITVADAVVSVAATAVKTTVKVGAAAVDLAIPDKKSSDEVKAVE